MPSEFVNAVTKHNLCTWYLLPLIFLNKASFGVGNFIESYVSSSGGHLCVDVVMLDLCHRDCLKSGFLLNKAEQPQQFAHLWYYIPSKWQKDFELFKAGKFSQFSAAAKHNIREYSGLFHGTYGDGEMTMDARLGALEKSPILRKAWEEDLILLPLPEDLELMPIPSERTYREYSLVD